MIVGSGVDVIEVARIERALARSGERFVERVFTGAEVAASRRHARPGLHFALRFAAKEAGMKAVGTGWGQGVRWRDLEALRLDELGGAAARKGTGWRLILRGRAAEIAAARGGRRAHLCVGRSRTHALAMVLLEGRPARDGGGGGEEIGT